MSQYFDNDASIVSSPAKTWCWCGTRKLSFTTDNGVFSKGEIDEASLTLVQKITELSGRVLDLGCGYGFIGIYLAVKFPEIELWQSDVNFRALQLCEQNCQDNRIASRIIESDGFEKMDEIFDAVVLNPPIHAGKEVVYRLYDESLQHLNEGGKLYIVIRKKHGAASTVDHLRENGHQVEELYSKKGLYVYACSV